jgi:1-acyl-sn-glycerol-3-phosphate acyltransferase
MPSASLVTEPRWEQRLLYRFLRMICRLLAIMLVDYRCTGRQHLPARGGGLLLATHQSVVDPVLIGLVSNRPMSYLARKTLFKHPAFAWLLRTLRSIEIDREGGGLGGLKETLRQLRAERLVLIFPEGSRTRDGSVNPLKPGFLALARRGGVPLIPMAVVGAYDCWPRGQRLPNRHPTAVVIGEPIGAEQVAQLSDEQLLSELTRRLACCHRRGHQLLPLQAAGRR